MLLSSVLFNLGVSNLLVWSTKGGSDPASCERVELDRFIGAGLYYLVGKLLLLVVLVLVRQICHYCKLVIGFGGRHLASPVVLEFGYANWGYAISFQFLGVWVLVMLGYLLNWRTGEAILLSTCFCSGGGCCTFQSLLTSDLDMVATAQVILAKEMPSYYVICSILWFISSFWYCLARISVRTVSNTRDALRTELCFPVAWRYSVWSYLHFLVNKVFGKLWIMDGITRRLSGGHA